MIEGLHFDVSSDEMTKILQERINQCNEKINLYELQAKAQDDLAKKYDEGKENDMPKVSNSQADNLRARISEYKQKVREYTFLLNHVIKNEVYRLERDDLQYLGIVQSRY